MRVRAGFLVRGTGTGSLLTLPGAHFYKDETMCLEPPGFTHAARKLLEAKALVQRGWCKYVPYRISWRGKDKYCALGAMGAVGAPPDAYVALGQAVGWDSKRWNGLGRWNDSLWRTKRSVLRAFDRAVTIAETM